MSTRKRKSNGQVVYRFWNERFELVEVTEEEYLRPCPKCGQREALCVCPDGKLERIKRIATGVSPKPLPPLEVRRPDLAAIRDKLLNMGKKK